MFKFYTSKRFYCIELVVIVGLLGFAYYLEWFQGLAPCALCEIQRMVFVLLGFLFFCSMFRSYKLMDILISFTALLGILFALRQVWIQHLPPATFTGTCDTSLWYLLQIMSFSDAMLNVFLGGPECAKVTWQFLHLSIAEWSLVWFTLFFIFSLFSLLGKIF